MVFAQRLCDLQHMPGLHLHHVPAVHLLPSRRSAARPQTAPQAAAAAAPATAKKADTVPGGPGCNQWPIWRESSGEASGRAPYPTLQQNLLADVCVCGAGIAGLTTALNLLKAGKSVVVLEADKVSSGQTGRSTAQMMVWNDDNYATLIDQFGRRKVRQVAKAHRDAIKSVQQVCEAEGIDCNLEVVDGYLFPHDSSPAASRRLDLELLAAKDAKIPGVEKVNLGGGAAVGGITTAIKFPGCVNIDPVRYVQGLAQAVTKAGGRIFESSRVKEAGDNKCVVKTENGSQVTADKIVLATNSPLHHNLAIHSRQEAYRTYVIGLRIDEGSCQNAQFWSTADPYHYLRVVKGSPKGDVLLVGGSDHPCGEGPGGIPPDPWADLERWARARWTGAGEVVYKWDGQVYDPIDGLGLFGQDPFNDFQVRGSIYTATGDSGQGITGGVSAGAVIAAAILKRRDPYKDVFSPSRLPSPLGGTGENLASVLTHVSKGYLGAVLPTGTARTAGASLLQPQSVADMPRSTGAVLTEGTRKVAAWKDENGVVARRSAICPHMLCACEWNPAAETFECPCHGSYWDKNFKLQQGPAKSDLPPLP